MAINFGAALQSGLNSANQAGQFGQALGGLWGNYQQYQNQQQQQQRQSMIDRVNQGTNKAIMNAQNQFFGNQANPLQNYNNNWMNQAMNNPQFMAEFGQYMPRGGTPNNPYAFQGMQGSIGAGNNNPTMSAQNIPSGVTQGFGGTPVFPAQNTNAFEQYFQGGSVPQEIFGLTQSEQSAADEKAKRQKQLEGWKWWADKGLQGLEGLAPIAGGLAGLGLGGPAGAALGQAGGGALAGLANLGRQGLRG